MAALPFDAAKFWAAGEGLEGKDHELFLEVFQVVSDAVQQDAWQTLCNFIIVLRLIHLRHPWLTQCFETSDGAPNYVAGLFQLGLRFMFEKTGIAVVMSHNNEPGCGKNIGDTLGAVAARLAKNHATAAACFSCSSCSSCSSFTAAAIHAAIVGSASGRATPGPKPVHLDLVVQQRWSLLPGRSVKWKFQRSPF